MQFPQVKESHEKYEQEQLIKAMPAGSFLLPRALKSYGNAGIFPIVAAYFLPSSLQAQANARMFNAVAIQACHEDLIKAFNEMLRHVTFYLKNNLLQTLLMSPLLRDYLQHNPQILSSALITVLKYDGIFEYRQLKPIFDTVMLFEDYVAIDNNAILNAALQSEIVFQDKLLLVTELLKIDNVLLEAQTSGYQALFDSLPEQDSVQEQQANIIFSKSQYYSLSPHKLFDLLFSYAQFKQSAAGDNNKVLSLACAYADLYVMQNLLELKVVGENLTPLKVSTCWEEAIYSCYHSSNLSLGAMQEAQTKQVMIAKLFFDKVTIQLNASELMMVAIKCNNLQLLDFLLNLKSSDYVRLAEALPVIIKCFLDEYPLKYLNYKFDSEAKQQYLYTSQEIALKIFGLYLAELQLSPAPYIAKDYLLIKGIFDFLNTVGYKQVSQELLDEILTVDLLEAKKDLLKMLLSIRGVRSLLKVNQRAHKIIKL